MRKYNEEIFTSGLGFEYVKKSKNSERLFDIGYGKINPQDRYAFQGNSRNKKRRRRNHRKK